MDSEAYIFEVINGQSLLVKDNFGNYYQVSTNTNSYNFEVKKINPQKK